jgi:hypothetical protein
MFGTIQFINVVFLSRIKERKAFKIIRTAVISAFMDAKLKFLAWGGGYRLRVFKNRVLRRLCLNVRRIKLCIPGENFL